MPPRKPGSSVHLFHGRISPRRLLFLKLEKQIPQDVMKKCSFSDEKVVFGNAVVVVWHNRETDEIHFLRVIRQHAAGRLGVLDEEMPNLAALAYPIHPLHGIISNGCKLFVNGCSENFCLGYIYADKIRTICASALAPFPRPNSQARATETSFRQVLQDAMMSNAEIRDHLVAKHRPCSSLFTPQRYRSEKPYEWLDNLWPFASADNEYRSPRASVRRRYRAKFHLVGEKTLMKRDKGTGLVLPPGYDQYLLSEESRTRIIVWLITTRLSREPTLAEDLDWIETVARRFQGLCEGELVPTPASGAHLKRTSSIGPGTTGINKWTEPLDRPRVGPVTQFGGWPWRYRRRLLIEDEIWQIGLGKYRGWNQRLRWPCRSTSRDPVNPTVVTSDFRILNGKVFRVSSAL